MVKKLIIVACLLVAINGLSRDAIKKMKEEMRGHITDCKDEVGATSDDVQQIFNHEIPVTHSGKCLLACAGKKSDSLDESGHIDEIKIRESVEKLKELDEDLYEKMRTITENCLEQTQNEENECDTAANLFSCMYKEKRATGLAEVWDE